MILWLKLINKQCAKKNRNLPRNFTVHKNDKRTSPASFVCLRQDASFCHFLSDFFFVCKKNVGIAQWSERSNEMSHIHGILREIFLELGENWRERLAHLRLLML